MDTHRGRRPAPYRPARLPLAVLAKPVGPACNLDCAYCYFLSKEVLHGGDAPVMDDALLRAYLANLLESSPDGRVEIAWQGGEPTLAGLDFYRRAVALAETYRRPGQQVAHVLQTNGVTLDEEWAAFLAEHRFLVGLSVDGPAGLHDVHRRNRAGRGTHAAVVRAWRLLAAHGVDVNAMCAVTATNAVHPVRVYRHLRDDLGARHIQFVPVVERATAEDLPAAERGWRTPDGARILARQAGTAVTSRSVDGRAWGDFLCAVFDEWLAHDVGRVFVGHVESALANALGAPSTCAHAPTCGQAPVVDADGSIYSCDHYVEPGHRRGDVRTTSLQAVLTSPRQVAFGRAKLTTLPARCRGCDVRWACHGGCPKDRLVDDGDGPLNHLCAGYRAFFTHVTPTVAGLAAALRGTGGASSPDLHSGRRRGGPAGP